MAPTNGYGRVGELAGQASGASSLTLYADSILRFGISSNQSLTSKKSNSELVHSLRALLDSALQPDGEADVYWDHRMRRVSIPHPSSLDRACADEPREALDVTVKMFYLCHKSKVSAQVESDCLDEALHQLKIASGIEAIDTLILSFPGIAFDEDQPNPSLDGCCDEAFSKDRTESKVQPGSAEDEVLMSRIAGVWQWASHYGNVRSIGLSEFSHSRLRRFLADLKERPGSRKPRVNQVNLRESGSVPGDLVKLATAEGIDLLTHSDCSDLLPPETFADILATVAERLPPPLLEKVVSPLQPAQPRPFAARWVLKYIVLQKQRGVIIDKGYVVCAGSLD